MIKSFKHKGLQIYFKTGIKKGITAAHAGKLARILDRLDAAINLQDMNLPGYNLHQLSGRNEGTWAVKVSGNWRITFKFEGENAVYVDYVDYH